MKRNKWWRMSWMLLSLLMVFSSVVPAFSVYAEEDPAAGDEIVLAEDEATEEKEVIAWEDLAAGVVTEEAPEADDERVAEEAENTGETIVIGGYEVRPEDYENITRGIESGHAEYYPDDKILKFFGETEGAAATIENNTSKLGLISVDQDLTIMGKVHASADINKSGGKYGIHLCGDNHTLTIAGEVISEGTLGSVYVEKGSSTLVVEDGATLNGRPLLNTVPQNGTQVFGIWCNGDLTIKGGSIQMYGQTHVVYCGGDLEFGGGASMQLYPTNPEYCNTYGLYLGIGSTFTMNSGTITMPSLSKDSALFGESFIMYGGNINVKGGLANDYNVKFKNFTLNSGVFTVTKSTTGGAALYITDDFVINGGQLNVNAADSSSVALASKQLPVFADGIAFDSADNRASQMKEQNPEFVVSNELNKAKYIAAKSSGNIADVVMIKRPAPQQYPLYVGNTHVNEENCAHIPVKGGSASYDPDTHILMLKDVTGVIGTDQEETKECLISCENTDLIISGNAALSSTLADSVGVYCKNANITFSGELDIATTKYGIWMSSGDLKDIRFNEYADINIEINPDPTDNFPCGIYNAGTGGAIVIDDDAKDVNISVSVGANEDGSFSNNNAIGIYASGSIYSGTTNIAPAIKFKKGFVDVTATKYGLKTKDLFIGPETDIKAKAKDGNEAIVWEGNISFPETNYTVVKEPANVQLSGDKKKYIYNSGDTGKKVNYIWLGVYRLSVSFNMCGHGDAIDNQYIIKDIGLVTKPADPTEAGWTFVGWYTDEACTKPFDFATKITTDITLYAKWLNGYSVSFNMCGHGDEIPSQRVDAGKTATKPEDPKAEGFEFGGWYTDAEYTTAFDFATPITADITLYAKWLTIYTVSFNMCGHGDPIEGQKVAEGKTVTKPADPKAEAYDFAGWYTEAACTNAYDFAAPVTADLNLYAKWDIAASAMNPIPEITANTKEIYLVKGQSFALPEGKWTSDQPKAVKITKKGTFLSAKKVTEATKPAVISLEGSTRTIKVYVTLPKYEKKKLSFSAGVKKQSLGFTYDKHMAIQWATSAPDVATVSQNGLVNAVAKGKATITAYINGKAYSCTVTVKEDNAVAERTLHLNLKKSKKVSIKGVKANKAEWSVSDNSIAEVKKGKITAGEKAGTTTVTCKNTDGRTYKIIVTVEDPAIKTGQIEEAGKNKYKVTLAKAGAKAKVTFNNVVQPVIFKSSAGAKAYFDKEGNIVANGKGKATLKAKINGTTVSIKVTVSE